MKKVENYMRLDNLANSLEELINNFMNKIIN